jgi:hypothetical protein
VAKRKLRQGKRLTVISRRRAWDTDAFARVLAAYVLHQLDASQNERHVDSIQDIKEGTP